MFRWARDRITKLIWQDLWRVSLRDLPLYKTIPLKLARITVVAFRGVWTDRLSLRASALTYYSLLAIVPLVAVAFGVAKWFGIKGVVQGTLVEKLGGSPEVMKKVVEMSKTLLEEVRGGVVGGVGLLLLLWSAYKVLRHAEAALNDIWGPAKGKALVRQLTDYVGIILFCPILLFISGILTVAAGRYILQLAKWAPLSWMLNPAAAVGLRILPYFAIWVVFTFAYVSLPHTRVSLISALAGGILAGSIYQLTQSVYASFQIGVSRMNAIYGSLAALPLLMVWIHLSWLIFLFGAEVCYAHQNLDALDMESEAKKPSFSYRLLAGLRVCRLTTRRFTEGEPAPDPETISEELKMPTRLVAALLDELVRAGLLTRSFIEDRGVAAYQPGIPVEKLTVARVTEGLMQCGGPDKPMRQSEEMQDLNRSLQGFRKAIEEAPENVRLVDV